MRAQVREQRRARAARRAAQPRSRAEVNMAQMSKLIAAYYLPYMREMLNNSTVLFERLRRS